MNPDLNPSTNLSTSNNDDDDDVNYKFSPKSFSHLLQSSSAVSESLTGEVSEDNNNLLHGVNLIDLKLTDNEDQHSNSSSLESRNSLTNHQGSQDGDGESGSTSCSEDSFEMSSTCSVREDFHEENKMRMPEANDVYPRESDFSNKAASQKDHFRSVVNCEVNLRNDVLYRIRESVANQIDKLDTGLPELDFEKLEKQLTDAAKEREDVQKRMMLDEDERDWKRGQSFQYHKKPASVLRLPANKNLQVCFMNELSETETENDSEDSDMEHTYVRKSKSMPSFKNETNTETLNMRSLQELHEKLERNVTLNDNDHCKILRYEAQRVGKIAEEKAKAALAEYRRGKSKASVVPRQARQYLSKTKLKEIRIIHQTMEEAISKKNAELVGLLLERDNLHMEHDSLRVDIDDYTQQKSPLILLNLKHLLKLQKGLGS